MEIKLIMDDDIENVINMQDYSVSLTHKRFEKKDENIAICFSDIKEIHFNSEGAIMQMIDGIISTCHIEEEDTGKRIILGTYKRAGDGDIPEKTEMVMNKDYK